MADMLTRYLKRGDTFWDVGANVGFFSLYASKLVGPQGRVFSFEPSPDVHALLLANTTGISNISVLQAGIGNCDGQSIFAAQGSSSSASFVRSVTEITSHCHPSVPIQEVSVPVRKLDSIAHELSSAASLIKIDVEGFELEVLKGAARVLSSNRPIVVIEIHPPQLELSNGTENALFRFLKDHQYSWQVIDKRPNSIYTIVAESSP